MIKNENNDYHHTRMYIPSVNALYSECNSSARVVPTGTMGLPPTLHTLSLPIKKKIAVMPVLIGINKKECTTLM
jgi:hypothetical protein